MAMDRPECDDAGSSSARRTHLMLSLFSTLKIDIRGSSSGSQIVAMMHATEPWH